MISHLFLRVALLAAALSLPVSASAASASKVFTVSNTGNGLLTISDAAISGNDSEFALAPGGCATPLQPGSSCNFTVSFAPLGTGARPPALLAFTSNGANGPRHTISLSGTGGASCVAGKQVFSYTGGDQFVQVPAGCTGALVKAWGAGGRAAAPYLDTQQPTRGGGGGFAQRALTNLAAGTTLTVVVGQGATSNAATYGGGASGGYAGGGGLSGVFSGSKTQANAILIAGGGGGGVNNMGGAGGGQAGGSPADVAAFYYDGIFIFQGGKGGTQTAGGSGGGMEGPGASPGGVLVGGTGNGSGGGGGYWGGGGSDDQAGGGGSGYAPGGTLIAGSGCAVANSRDVDYITGVGKGGCTTNTSGGNGRVVIQWQ